MFLEYLDLSKAVKDHREASAYLLASLYLHMEQISSISPYPNSVFVGVCIVQWNGL